MSYRFPIALYYFLPMFTSRFAAGTAGTATSTYTNAWGVSSSLIARSLIREIEDTAKVLDGRVRVGCVYVGGGTPSLIGANLLTEILDALSVHFGFERGAEATVEANPSNTTVELAFGARRRWI